MNKKNIYRLIWMSVVVLAMSFTSCHETEEWENSYADNFDALWTILDEHYCFFEEKGIDWDSIYNVYRPQITQECSTMQLFDVCSRMLDELKDGHVNMSTWFATTYYRRWWTDYPQNYDARIVEQYYLNFNYRMLGGIKYGILMDNVGYISYPSFSYGLGESNIDAILNYMITCNGIIIDMRDNGGGNLSYVEPLVRRFIPERICAGYIIHKTGPGHNDFSKPFAFYYDPVEPGHTAWLKPVVVLTNRSTFSAANNFVAIMKCLPQVSIVGATTGGGGGMPYSSELPCGWSLRFSACPVLDPNGNETENGVEPSEGCAVDLDLMQAVKGVDTMLEKAIAVINR